MSHLTHTKTVLPLAQRHNSLRFVGRPVSSVRYLQAGPTVRFSQAALSPKHEKMKPALVVNRTRSTGFSIFTRKKTTNEGSQTEDAAAIASLNSPELSGPNNPIEIQETPGKRYGVFATRSIPAGRIILAEMPLVQSSTANRVAIEVSCALLNPQEQAFFRLLRGTRQGSESDSPTVQIWNTNQFHMPHDLHVGCVYAKASMVNHGCDPNADYTFTKEKHIVITSTRDIGEGEEVTISYVGPEVQTMPVEYRKTALLERSGFECQCEACAGGRLVKNVPRYLTDRRRPFPMERLSDVNIFNVSDETSQRGAIEANRLLMEWTTDFRKRDAYWQIIMKGHARTQGDASMLTEEIVGWMAEHVKRTHNQWLAGKLPNKLQNKPHNKSPDKLTINLGSRKYVVPEDILVPYLDRMTLRANLCLLHGGARGIGLRGVRKFVEARPGEEHDLSYECEEIMRGVTKVVKGIPNFEWLKVDRMDENVELEVQRSAMDEVIEGHINAGFGKGFFKE